MRKFNTKAVVLKNINYKDADKLYTLLTQDEGKISALAKGVRKITSKRGGNLDTVNLISVSVSQGKGDFLYIEEVKVIESFKKIKASLEDMEDIYYILELVHKSLGENQGSGEIFNLLLETIRLIGKKQIANKIIISRFELLLMNYLGYEMNTKKCIKCSKTLDNSWQKYIFNIDLGGFACENCSAFGMNTQKETVHFISRIGKGSVLINAKNDVQNEADNIIKIFIKYHLGDNFKSLELKEL